MIFSEYFYIPISYLDKNDYLKSWKKSIENGVFCARDSILYVSMCPEDCFNFVYSVY